LRWFKVLFTPPLLLCTTNADICAVARVGGSIKWLEFFIFHIKVPSRDGVVHLKNTGIAIDSLLFSTFFGGNTAESSAHPHDEFIYFDDFIVRGN